MKICFKNIINKLYLINIYDSARLLYGFTNAITHVLYDSCHSSPVS